MEAKVTETNGEVNNPYAALEDRADPTVPTATLQIYDGIARLLERPKDTNVSRASSANMCVRRRWYQHHGYDGKPLTPRKVLNFLNGDLGEKCMQWAIKNSCVGPGKLYSEIDFGEKIGEFTYNGKTIDVYRQQDLTADMGMGLTITAHADGWGRRNSDGRWELIECKTASDYGFKDFQNSGPGDYIKQSHALMMTGRAKELGVTEVRFFFMKKSTGHIWDRMERWNDDVAEEVRVEFHQAIGADIPNKPYVLTQETFRRKPTGRVVPQWQCQYCPFLTECQGEHEIEWKADQFGTFKPNYIFGGKKT